nr:PREDICTED: thymic stromal lymphopoietin [Bos mutus]
MVPVTTVENMPFPRSAVQAEGCTHPPEYPLKKIFILQLVGLVLTYNFTDCDFKKIKESYRNIIYQELNNYTKGILFTGASKKQNKKTVTKVSKKKNRGDSGSNASRRCLRTQEIHYMVKGRNWHRKQCLGGSCSPSIPEPGSRGEREGGAGFAAVNLSPIFVVSFLSLFQTKAIDFDHFVYCEDQRAAPSRGAFAVRTHAALAAACPGYRGAQVSRATQSALRVPRAIERGAWPGELRPPAARRRAWTRALTSEGRSGGNLRAAESPLGPDLCWGSDALGRRDCGKSTDDHNDIHRCKSIGDILVLSAMGNIHDVIITTALSENQLSDKHSEMLDEFPKEMSEQLAEALRRRRGLPLKSINNTQTMRKIRKRQIKRKECLEQVTYLKELWQRLSRIS